MTVERRIVSERLDIRTAARASGDVSQIVGYGALFNVEAVIGNNFREVIRRGAFSPVIGPSADIVSLFNHDASSILGRTTAGTLRVFEDATGLRYEADLNASDPRAMGVAANVTRRDVTGSSFGFRVERDEWTKPTRAGELPLRTIHEFAQLIDVGPVTFPAYSESSSEARAVAASMTRDADRARRLRLAICQSHTCRATISDADRVRAFRLECARTRPGNSTPRTTYHPRSDADRGRWLRTAEKMSSPQRS